MALRDNIQLYNPSAFTARFMPSPALQALLKGDFNKFLIVRVEEMYRHVTRPVPATRATIHTCLFLTEGQATMKIGSERYTIRRHEMLVVPAGQVFSFGEKDVNKGYICCFHNDMLVGKYGKSELLKEFEFLQVWGNPRLTPDNQTARFVLHLFKRLHQEYTDHGLQHLNILQPYLITLLCEVNRIYTPVATHAQTAAVTLANKFRALLFTNVCTMHRVSDYAAALHVSPNHLNKSVKAATEKSPTRWIDEAIVLEAKVLLSQSTLTVAGVALAVGLDDPSYFARLFRKHTGTTPTAFRKMIEKS
ncbi:AraC family transcriptional regulator [Dawidia soli]|uniref:AraC family transcriptional regulator n=1 Tax=Dawidia soli TaxID=2782352 RepID=A0AAP2DEJ4_9BACT|nr:helix-turn-helix transcriptional regulator [Dawidia soli]MBT1689696.1 AraC family transcriptional regulator [Dawidia soli]